MNVFPKQDVVLVTTTMYSSMNDIRAPLAVKTCLAAKNCGYRIIVADDSSYDIKVALRETGATVIDRAPGLGIGASRRLALVEGVNSKARVVVWLEPEKYTLIPLLVPSISKVFTREVDVVVPRRKNLDTYPEYQHFSELRGNHEIGNVTGRPDLDLYFGPRVLSSEAAEFMSKYIGKCGENTYADNWEILFIPIVWMLTPNQSRFIVKSVVVDYDHPPEQLIEDDLEMKIKRDRQRSDIVSSVTQEAKRLGLSAL
jgi:hypothetical protein